MGSVSFGEHLGGQPSILGRRIRADGHFLLTLDTQRTRFRTRSFSHGVIFFLFLVLRSTTASLSWASFTAAAYVGRQTWHQFAFGFVDFEPPARGREGCVFLAS